MGKGRNSIYFRRNFKERLSMLTGAVELSTGISIKVCRTIEFSSAASDRDISPGLGIARMTSFSERAVPSSAGSKMYCTAMSVGSGCPAWKSADLTGLLPGLS